MILSFSQHCDDMATDIDIIRKEYWVYMKRTFQSKLPAEQLVIE